MVHGHENHHPLAQVLHCYRLYYCCIYSCSSIVWTTDTYLRNTLSLFFIISSQLVNKDSLPFTTVLTCLQTHFITQVDIWHNNIISSTKKIYYYFILFSCQLLLHKMWLDLLWLFIFVYTQWCSSSGASWLGRTEKSADSLHQCRPEPVKSHWGPNSQTALYLWGQHPRQRGACTNITRVKGQWFGVRSLKRGHSYVFLRIYRSFSVKTLLKYIVSRVINISRPVIIYKSSWRCYLL